MAHYIFHTLYFYLRQRVLIFWKIPCIWPNNKTNMFVVLFFIKCVLDVKQWTQDTFLKNSLIMKWNQSGLNNSSLAERRVMLEWAGYETLILFEYWSKCFLGGKKVLKIVTETVNTWSYSDARIGHKCILSQIRWLRYLKLGLVKYFRNFLLL